MIYDGENYNDFGLHPACGHMADLFNSQVMSVICNVGNLYEPITRDQFLNGGSIPPPQLFSHADQQQFQSEDIDNNKNRLFFCSKCCWFCCDTMQREEIKCK